jgi:MYXO-CTERM domain-containing protein
VLSPGNVDVDSSSYAWGLFTDTIDLGVINPFEVINIEYTVKSTASGLEDDRFFFFLNDGEVPEFGTRTFFNDPTGFTFSTPLANPPTEASAPAGLLLSLLGLGGILVLRRKK